MSLLKRAEQQRLLRGNEADASPESRKSHSFNDQVQTYRRLLLEEVDLEELSKLERSQRRVRLERILSHILSQQGPVLSSKDRSRLVQRVVDEALGLGILEPLLADESITEIMVNGPKTIFVERAGRLEKLDLQFANNEQLMQVIDRIVAEVNRRVDESSPMVDARLLTGERVNVIVPPLAMDGPTLTIRRFPKPFSLEDLQAKGSFDELTREFLMACVKARFNIVVSGGTGTGKTTMLNALSGMIPDGDRIVTIEDSAELQLQQPHVIRLESRPPNVEGKGQVTIRDLVKNSLRMRPDRIIVGEVRGGETLDMLQAMNTGHDGSLVTVHANNPLDAVSRLETLASMSEVRIPFEALKDQINSAVDLIVQLGRGADGSRRMTEVAAVTSESREEFELTTLMKFEAEPLTADRVVRGTHVMRQIPANIADRLWVSGSGLSDRFQIHPDAMCVKANA